MTASARYAATTYRRPAARFKPAALLVLFALCALGGLLVGIVAGAVAEHYWLELFFPILFGGLAALACRGAIEVTRTHARLAGALAGLIAGLATGVSMQGFANQRACHLGLARILDVRAFEACLDWRAEAGFTQTSKTAGRRTTTTISGHGAYVHWEVELGLMALLGMMGGIAAASDPFCACCDGLVATRFLGSCLGPSSTLAQAVAAGDLGLLRAHQPKRRSDSLPQRLPEGELALSMKACGRCGPVAPIVVDAYAGGSDRNGPVAAQTVGRFYYPGEAATVLRDLFDA